MRFANMHKIKIGVVLAGGQSSRMGRNKALLSLAQGTMLTNALDILQQVPVDELLISGQVPGFNTIVDNVPNQGPVGGICTILASLFDRGVSGEVIFIPVDMPLLKSETLQYLLHQMLNVDAIYIQNHPLPFIIRLNENVNSIVQRQNRLKINSVKAFIAQCRHRCIALESDDLINVNTPFEFQTMLERINRESK